MKVPEIFAAIVQLHQDIISYDKSQAEAQVELTKLAELGKVHELKLNVDVILQSMIDDYDAGSYLASSENEDEESYEES